MEPIIAYKKLPVSTESITQLIKNRQLYEVLTAALSIDLFSKLCDPVKALILAEENDWDARTLELMLGVLKEAGYLLEKDGDFQNSAIARSYFRPGEILYQGHQFLEDFEHFEAGSFGFSIMKCLNKNPGYLESPEPDWNPERLRRIGAHALDGTIQATVAAIDLKEAKTLLDLGGGHGFYSIALVQKYGRLKVTLFDLPAVINLAKKNLEEFKLSEQISSVSGNFMKDDIGSGYDAILCANILHSDKRDTVLGKVYKALNPGGKLIVKCRIKDVPPSLGNALTKLDWYIDGGKEMFTREQWRKFIELHGFCDVQIVDVYGIYATITAKKY